MSNPEFIGIDVANSKIKLAQSKSKGDSFEVERLARVDADINLVDSTDVSAQQTAAELLAETIKKNKFRSKNCVMSIPEKSIFSRLITLPKMAPNELNEGIHWAVKPQVPVSLENLNISYLEIDSFKKDSTDMTNWYVVAAPKDLIERYKTFAGFAGLNLLAIETEALAVIRTIHANYLPQGDYLVLDLGAESTNVILARKRAVVFSQTLSTGSDAITKVISSDFGIDAGEAEKYKLSYGIDFTQGDGKIAKSIQSVVDLIMNEVTRTMSFYREKIDNSQIQTIYVTGGGSKLPGLAEYIKSKVEVAPVIVNNFEKIKIDNKLISQIDANQVSGFNVSIGLSLKGIG